MIAVDTMTLDRDKTGKFKEAPDSLERKTIGLRLRKSLYPRFLELAEQKGITPAELARSVIEEWVGQQGSEGDE